MKNKEIEFWFLSLLFITIIIMILLILPKDIYFNYIEKNKVITLNSFYDPNLVEACYGNKFFVGHCENITDKLQVTGSVDSTKPGNYIVIYSIDYKGIKKEINQRVLVIDDEKPVIDFFDANTVVMCPNGKISEPSFRVYDNKDGNITKKTKKYIEGNKYKYQVTDSSGNVTTAYRDIIYEDTESPIIELLGGQKILLKLNEPYIEPGYNVYDNCSENLKEQVTISGQVLNNKKGTYLLTYSVTDEAGNTMESVRKVIVGTQTEKKVNKIVDKKVYLTFDDGPNYNTELLLEVLKKYNVKATFFVTGQFPKYEYVIKKIYDDGHALGLHTYSHQFKKIYASEENFFNDLEMVQEMIKRQTGTETKLMRYAGGSSNKVSKFNPGIMTRLDKLVKEKGYYPFDWNVDSRDTKYSDPDKIANEVIKHIKYNKSHYIVLQHDIKKSNIKATEKIIKYGLNNGYIFEILTEETKSIQHHINN